MVYAKNFCIDHFNDTSERIETLRSVYEFMLASLPIAQSIPNNSHMHIVVRLEPNPVEY